MLVLQTLLVLIAQTIVFSLSSIISLRVVVRTICAFRVQVLLQIDSQLFSQRLQFVQVLLVLMDVFDFGLDSYGSATKPSRQLILMIS